MKYLLILIGISLYYPAYSQKTDTVLFNGVTKIIINNEKSAEENYKISGNVLLDQGYNIGNKDSEFFQLSSEAVKVAGEGAMHILSIYAVSKNNQIIITGKTKSLSQLKLVSWQESENAAEVVSYKKSKVLSRNVYDKLVKYMKALPSSKITYSE